MQCSKSLCNTQFTFPLIGTTQYPKNVKSTTLPIISTPTLIWYS